jgi:hypothetical protein
VCFEQGEAALSRACLGQGPAQALPLTQQQHGRRNKPAVNHTCGFIALNTVTASVLGAGRGTPPALMAVVIQSGFRT